MLAAFLLSLALDPLVLGPEVEASVNADGGVLRCEPSVGISGERVLVAWNDSHGGSKGSQTGVCVAWSHSRDGGKTFKFGGYLTERNGVTAGADSRVARGTDGALYLSVLSWLEKEHAIWLYRFDPAAAKMSEVGRVASNDGEGYLDKPDLAITKGGFFMAYTRDGAIEVARSADGREWTYTTVSGPESAARSGAGIAVHGQNIAVSWCEGGGLNLNRVMFAESKDGGKSYSKATEVFARRNEIKTPEGYRMAPGPAAVAFNDVRLAFDPGGLLWLCTLGDEGVVLMSREDGWTKSSLAGEVPAAFFPSLALLVRRPFVLTYGKHGRETHAYLVSGTATVLTTEGCDWTRVGTDAERAPIQRNFGDYISIAAEDRRFVAAWTDGRTGLPRIRVRSGELRPVP